MRGGALSLTGCDWWKYSAQSSRSNKSTNNTMRLGFHLLLYTHCTTKRDLQKFISRDTSLPLPAV